jgi:hypothetical protein
MFFLAYFYHCYSEHCAVLASKSLTSHRLSSVSTPRSTLTSLLHRHTGADAPAVLSASVLQLPQSGRRVATRRKKSKFPRVYLSMSFSHLCRPYAMDTCKSTFRRARKIAEIDAMYRLRHDAITLQSDGIRNEPCHQEDTGCMGSLCVRS